MMKFVVFEDGSFVNVEKIVAVRSYDDDSTTIYYDLIGTQGYITVKESTEEVRALIEKVLGSGVKFSS